MNARGRTALLLVGVVLLSLLVLTSTAFAHGGGPTPPTDEAPAAQTPNGSMLQEMQEMLGPEAWGRMIQHMTQVHGPEFTGRMLQWMGQNGDCHGGSGMGSGRMGSGFWGGMMNGGRGLGAGRITPGVQAGQ